MIMFYVGFVAATQAMWEIIMGETEVVGSRMPTFASESLTHSDRGYGQNGFSHASSDVPTEAPTVSGFLPKCVLPDSLGSQVRHVSGAGYPPAFGMRKR